MFFRLISFVVLLTAYSVGIANDVKVAAEADVVVPSDTVADTSVTAELDEQENLPDDSLPPSTDIVRLVDTTLIIPLVYLKNVGVDDAILTLFRPHKINVWVSPEVMGNITVYLTDVSLLDAFGFIIEEDNLRYEIENNIIRVYPRVKKRNTCWKSTTTINCYPLISKLFP